jgi:hypothetical protein
LCNCVTGRRNRLLHLVAAVLLSFTAFAAGPSDRKQIEAVYRQYAYAFEMKDFQSLESLLAPSYTSVVDGRSLGHDDAVAAVKSQSKKAGAPVRCGIKIARLTIDGTEASAQVSEGAHYILRASDKSLHRFRYVRERQDRLVLVQGRWLIDASRRGDKASYWVDNKPASADRVRTVFGPEAL